MLNGEPYLPYHPLLLSERDQCKSAVYRLNYTSNDAVQITRDERHRHFQAIVQARWVMHYRGGPEPPTTGHVGPEVFVDTPFHCDYGYNLSIGDLVTIGPHCKFLDSGRITIGRGTKVSANVTIDTQKIPTDSKSMKGSRGTAIAAEVHIGENVYIGANATICAGVKIGTGAIIHPGSVVLKVGLLYTARYFTKLTNSRMYHAIASPVATQPMYKL
jgi:acetyltransferase-like isoleucine patch superfamily enzyme